MTVEVKNFSDLTPGQARAVGAALAAVRALTWQRARLLGLLEARSAAEDGDEKVFRGVAADAHA